MKDLSKNLEKEGYDLLDGTLREQRLLQIWRKRFNNPIESLASSIHHIFNATTPLGTTTSTALDVVSNASQELKFNIGITVLEDILSKNNLGKLDLGTKISSGKKVDISYSNAFSETVEQLDLENFLAASDFVHPNPGVLKDLNRDNLIVITGVVYAKNLKAIIESESEIDASIDAEVNAIVGGKIGFTRESTTKIVLTAPLGETFPIAIKYHKMRFRDGAFKKLVLVSDSKDWF
ncbi:hypothetical protein [Runella sp. SP2]|uniref:gasdermin n=1 Tax=Runella sp. SP2 TaxID=2268026 RepID=UPI000F08004A|nr:hypothetical protein [Runella sp. SP2]AYQ35314.1 hypothetical protein DTQ70_25510 [Runella sp. SP2]